MRYRLNSSTAAELLERQLAVVEAAPEMSRVAHPSSARIQGAAFAYGPPTMSMEELEPLCKAEIHLTDPGLKGWWAREAVLIGLRFLVLDRRWLMFNRLSGDETRTPDANIDQGLIIDQRGQVFLDSSDLAADYFGGRYVLAFWEPAQMYHHWVFECLTRIVAVLDNEQLGDVRLLVPSNAPGFVAETLELLGVPASRIAFFDPSRSTTVEALLLIPVPPVELNRCAISALNRLREAVLPTLSPTPLDGRKVLFTRKDALSGERLLINEQAVIDELESQGFAIVTPTDFSVKQQMSIAHHASFVACVHGSAGANMLFCQRNSRVLHLFPDCVHYFHAHGIGTAIAGARYAYIYGSSFQRGIRYHNNPWLLGPGAVTKAVGALEAQ